MCAHHNAPTVHAVVARSRVDFGTVSSVLSALDVVTSDPQPPDDLAQTGPGFDEIAAALREGWEA